MKKNVGSADRLVRFSIAAVVAVLLLANVVPVASTLGIVLAVAGGIALFTASVNWCALYAVVGASTCKVEN